MKHKSLYLPFKCLLSLMVCLALVLLPAAALATDLPPSAAVPEGSSSAAGSVPTTTTETEGGTVFRSGSTVTIAEDINGNAFASGETVTVSGTVKGDVFAAGNRVIIDGVVTGNVFAAGRSVHLGPQADIRGDVYLTGQSLSASSTAKIAQEAYLAGQDLTLAGTIGRQLWASGEKIRIDALIKGDAKAEGDKVSLQKGSVIGGNFTYSGKLTQEPGAKIKGDTIQLRTSTGDKDTPLDMFFAFLETFLAAFGFWLIIRLGARSAWPKMTRPFFRRPVKSLIIGLLLTIGVPLFAILFFFTIKGIPLALTFMAVYISSASLPAFVLALFLAALFSAKKDCRGTASPLLMILMILILAGVQTGAGYLSGVGPMVSMVLGLLSLWLFWSMVAACFIAANDADDLADDLAALQAEEAQPAEETASPKENPVPAAEVTRREKPLAPTVDDHDNDATRINIPIDERAHGRRSDNPVEPMDPKNPLSGDHDA